MKKIILAILISSFSTGSFANTQKSEFCTLTSNQAKNIMLMRQTGDYPLTKLIKLIEDMENNERTIDGMELMAINAYKEPLWTNEKLIKRTINEFENQTYIDCISNISKYLTPTK